jgi:hypothetical protein
MVWTVDSEVCMMILTHSALVEAKWGFVHITMAAADDCCRRRERKPTPVVAPAYKPYQVEISTSCVFSRGLLGTFFTKKTQFCR